MSDGVEFPRDKRSEQLAADLERYQKRGQMLADKPGAVAAWNQIHEAIDQLREACLVLEEHDLLGPYEEYWDEWVVCDAVVKCCEKMERFELAEEIDISLGLREPTLGASFLRRFDEEFENLRAQMEAVSMPAFFWTQEPVAGGLLREPYEQRAGTEEEDRITLPMVDPSPEKTGPEQKAYNTVCERCGAPAYSGLFSLECSARCN